MTTWNSIRNARALTALTCALALGILGGNAVADEQAVFKRVQEKFPQSYVEKVFRTPFPGMYEVLMDSKLFYTDEHVSYVMIGNLIDIKSGKNLTRERLRKLTAIDWKELPLDLAIKKVKGDGSRQLALFSDPLCPHCVTQEKEFAKLDNVTIYTFIYPIENLHKGSTALSRAVWCSPDRVKAWDDLVLNRTEPKSSSCADPIKKIDAVGTKLKIGITPTMIFVDGTVIVGGAFAQQIEKVFAAIAKK
jgi:thiol:disulfide interchange protein DsbC